MRRRRRAPRRWHWKRGPLPGLKHAESPEQKRLSSKTRNGEHPRVVAIHRRSALGEHARPERWGDPGGPEHYGQVIQVDEARRTVRLPGWVVVRTFDDGLWDEVNRHADVLIDTFEGEHVPSMKLDQVAAAVRAYAQEAADAELGGHLDSAIELIEDAARRDVDVFFVF